MVGEDLGDTLQGGTLSLSGNVVRFEGFTRADAENVFNALLALAECMPPEGDEPSV